MRETIKLTQFSKGAGCGCKIAPSVLEKILQPSSPKAGKKNPSLLVGNDTKDDAAVYDTGNDRAVISTTDFFMPIVDDPFDFGRIAAANAISDVYAMGGKPLMAIAILGWPVEKLSIEIAHEVLEGARKICAEAGIPLAGGHSIDSLEPIFGLAVTGQVEIKNIKKNSSATKGCKLYLTKPLGIGIITTAQKRGVASAEDLQEAIKYMTQLNSIGYEFGKLKYVKAMTDVTGFGLLGHLVEMCEGSGLSAEIEYEKIPLLKNLSGYISQKIYPGGTMRNWKSMEDKVNRIEEESIIPLCDPQTSGGLLVAVDPDYESDFLAFAKQKKSHVTNIGRLLAKQSPLVSVIE